MIISAFETVFASISRSSAKAISFSFMTNCLIVVVSRNSYAFARTVSKKTLKSSGASALPCKIPRLGSKLSSTTTTL